MDAPIAVFTPSIDDKRWVSQGSRALHSEFVLEIDSTPTIFQVPKSLNETNLEAYTPQLLGLGPYHHLRPDLHATDRQKLAVVNRFLKQKSSKNFSQDFLDRMKDFEPVVRANYDKYLDLECSSLEYIIAIDSFYLLDFLGTYDQQTDSANLEPGRQDLAKDLIMLENQIPAFAVAEMGKEVDLFSPDRGTRETMLHSQLFYYFCKAHSPLKPAELWGNRRSESSHLLAHMYQLIVNNRGFEEKSDIDLRMRRSRITEVGTETLTALSELGLGGAMIKPLLFAFKSLQVWENSKLADEITNTKEAKIQKIQIPSVWELSKKHGVDIRLLERGGIRDIEFDLEGKQALYLPEIRLNYDSEVVLRNLVAYEAAIATPESTLELAEYVDLMCGLLHTPKDVGMLREKGIVKGKLDDEQVSEIFNRISKSLGKSKEESASQKVVKQVKEMVEKWENQKLWKRLSKFLEKIVKFSVEFLRKPSGIAVKYLLYMFMVILLVLQIMQAYCQVYGCSKGGSEAAKALSLRMSG